MEDLVVEAESSPRSPGPTISLSSASASASAPVPPPKSRRSKSKKRTTLQSQSVAPTSNSVALDGPLSPLGKPQDTYHKPPPGACSSEPICGFRELLVCGSAIIVVAVAVCALLPTVILWLHSVDAIHSSAETSLYALIDSYRNSLVKKAVNNVTTRLSRPVILTQLVAAQIPATFFASDTTGAALWGHRILPFADCMFPGTASLFVAWNNSLGEHMFDTKFGHDSTYALCDTSRNESLDFYLYDAYGVPTGVYSGTTLYPYVPSQRVWWIDGTNVSKQVNGRTWSDPVFSKLSSEGFVVFSQFVVTKSDMPADVGVALIVITYEISVLVEYFNNMNLTVNGRVFLMTDTLLMVAGSDQYPVYDMSTLTSYSAIDNPNPDVSAAVQGWLRLCNGTRKPLEFRFQASVGEMFVDVAEIAAEGLMWWLVLLTPPGDFDTNFKVAHAKVLGRTRETIAIVVGVEIAFAIAVLAIALYFAVSVSNSLTRVARELQAVTEMQLRKRFSTHSHIREVFLLESNAQQMSIALLSFGKYVPRMVVKFLIQHNLEATVGIQKAQATVYFLDISNFTRSMQTYGPDVVIGIVTTLFESFSTILSQNGAIIDKYIGDSIMALWGVPEPIDNCQKRACKATHAIIKSLSDHNIEIKKRYGFTIGIRIGFHFGDVYAGNVGSTNRINYTVMGDTVNLSARLEPLGKEIGTCVCVTDAIRSHAEDEYAFRCLCKAVVKGFLQPVNVHEFLGLREELAPETKKMLEDYKDVDRMLARGESPLEAMRAYSLEHPEDVPVRSILSAVSSSANSSTTFSI